MIKLTSLIEGYILGFSVGNYLVNRPTITLTSNGKSIKARKGAHLYNLPGELGVYYVDPEQRVAYEIDWRNPKYTNASDKEKMNPKNWPMYTLRPGRGELIKIPAGDNSIVPQSKWQSWIRRV